MSNPFLSQVGLAGYDPQAAPRGTIAATPALDNEADASLVAMSSKLAAKFGAFADRAAQIEGVRAGKIQGNDPNYQPTGSTTIRGYAQDQAAIGVYTSNLTAKLGADMADAYEANKDNPAGFNAAATKLRAQYSQDHVFPEIQGEFNTRFTELATTYQKAAGNAALERAKDANKAALLGNMASRQDSLSRLAAGGGDLDALRRQSARTVADNEADIDGLVNSGVIPATKGFELKQQNRNTGASYVITAEAAKLKTPADIEAYRQKLQKDYADGVLKGIDPETYSSIDSQLARLATSVQTSDNQALNTLQKAADDMVARQSKGLSPTTAEWAQLTAQAQQSGLPGMQVLQEARLQSAIAAQVAAQPIETSRSQYNQLVAGLRTGPAAPEGGSLAIPTSANIAKVDSRLVDIMQSAAAASGLRIAVTPQGGANRRRAGTQNHPTGRALDIQIYDEAGQPLGNYQNATNFRKYEQFAQLARQIQVQKYPELGQAFRWGGYFGGRGYGGADLMHFDLSGNAGLGMGGGTWDGGMTAAQRALYPGAESQGIDMSKAIPGTGGAPAPLARHLEFMRKLIDDKEKALKEDPIGEWQRAGLLGTVTPFDPASPDAAGQLGVRVAKIDAAAKATGVAPVYLQPDEKERLTDAANKGGDTALNIMQQVVAGAGGAAGQSILKQIGADAPVAAQVGAVLADGGSVQAMRDAMTAQKLKREGSKLVEPPKTMMTETAGVMGGALAGNLAAAGRITQVANLIYATRMARTNTAPDSPEAGAIYEQAINDAAGAVVQGGVQYGGFGKVGNRFMPGRPQTTVLLPSGMSAAAFDGVLGAITDEDLSSLKAPPASLSGKPLTAGDLAYASPERWGDGYRFSVTDPQTGQRAYLPAKGGKPFVLPIDDLRQLLVFHRQIGDLQ